MRRAVCLALLVAFAGTSAAESPHFTSVSLPALLATPKSYDSKLVRTSGYARETTRGLLLFLTHGGAQHRLYTNAIVLEVDRSTQKGVDLVNRVDGQFVTVSGTFDWLAEGGPLILRNVSRDLVHPDQDAGGTAQ